MEELNALVKKELGRTAFWIVIAVAISVGGFKLYQALM